MHDLAREGKLGDAAVLDLDVMETVEVFLGAITASSAPSRGGLGRGAGGEGGGGADEGGEDGRLHDGNEVGTRGPKKI